jgi:2-(1,2-epoxy-1,2-dihydrophenyl)acetyl-CoA isomerase
MSSEPRVVVSIDAGIATVRLNDPASLNALSVAMATDLDQAIERLSVDPDVRCLVVTGTGRGFCAGGDVQSFYDHRDDPDETVRAVLAGLHGAVARLLDAPFPTIAAINGTVAGAGMGVAMATDLAVAVDTAVFTMAYTGIGVSPDGSSTYFLPRLVGTRRAMEMILTNTRLTATEAAELGLVNTITSASTFAETVDELARRLAVGPTLAYVRARHLVRSSFLNDPFSQMDAEGEGIVAASLTRDFYEGISAFIEKRRPEFEGR